MMVNPVLLPIKWAVDKLVQHSDRDASIQEQREWEREYVGDISRFMFRVGVTGIPIGGYRVGNKWMIRSRPEARAEEAYIPRGAVIAPQGTDDLFPRIEPDDIIPIVGYHI